MTTPHTGLPEFDPGRVEAKLARSDRPWVTLKAAATLDGRIAMPGGESRWITGQAAREAGHRLRACHGAVLVGINTVLADDPQLTVRLAHEGTAPQPARIVLDSRCRIAPAAKMLADDGAGRYVVVGRMADAARIEEIRATGAQVLLCDTSRPRPARFLPWLREQGVESILVEGGGTVHGALIAGGEADELFLFLSGKLIGNGPGWCGALGLVRLSEAPRLRLSPPRVVEEDIMLHGLFDPSPWTAQ